MATTRMKNTYERASLISSVAAVICTSHGNKDSESAFTHWCHLYPLQPVCSVHILGVCLLGWQPDSMSVCMHDVPARLLQLAISHMCVFLDLLICGLRFCYSHSILMSVICMQ